MMGDRRGTSEVVGFVLVFAVVFAGIGVVQTAGFDVVVDVRDQQRAASAERAFLALAGNVDDVRYGAPGRTGSLRPGPGRLQVEAGPTLTIVEDDGPRTVETDALTLRLHTTSTTYASGGVFRRDGEGSVVVREPALVCRRGSANATIVSMMTMRPAGAGIDTDGPVSVLVRANRTEAWRVDNVTLDVAGTRNEDAWARFLDRTGWNETAPSVYTCAGDRTYVHRTTVDVRFVA